MSTPAEFCCNPKARDNSERCVICPMRTLEPPTKPKAPKSESLQEQQQEPKDKPPKMKTTRKQPLRSWEILYGRPYQE